MIEDILAKLDGKTFDEYISSLDGEGLINSPHEDLSKFTFISTYKTLSGGIYMSKENQSQLSRRTKEHITRVLEDNNEFISVSVLAILMLLTKKGKI